MTYDKRADGRKGFDELRPIEAKAGVLSRADGSAMFKIGRTVAYAAVYGPQELHPRFLQNPTTGVLRCHYDMMPFSGRGDRIRPGGNRRAKEISMVMEKAIAPVLDLTAFPNTGVHVHVELPQTDAGSRCAAICAASIALADAGLPMKDLVTAIAVGRVDDKIVADLDYQEESYPEGGVADIPIAIIPSTGEISLLQMDGEMTKEQMVEALEMAKKVSAQIYEAQKKALKEKYTGGSQ